MEMGLHRKEESEFFFFFFKQVFVDTFEEIIDIEPLTGNLDLNSQTLKATALSILTRPINTFISICESHIKYEYVMQH